MPGIRFYLGGTFYLGLLLILSNFWRNIRIKVENEYSLSIKTVPWAPLLNKKALGVSVVIQPNITVKAFPPKREDESKRINKPESDKAEPNLEPVQGHSWSALA